MPPTDLTAAEVRVLGCLVEKQRTTPDHYPLSINALRNAANQSTNRDPVTDYDEEAVHEAARSLIGRRWVRSASGHGGRTLKYRHLLTDALHLDVPSQSLLAVLMLRGAQTPGELKQRTARLHEFGDTEAVVALLDQLIESGYVRRIPRRPGQKEDRYLQLLDSEEAAGTGAEQAGSPPGPTEEESTGATPPAPSAMADPTSEDEGSLIERVASLESEVAELKRRLDEVL